MSDEQLIHQTRLHPVIFAKPLVITAVMGALTRAFFATPALRTIFLALLALCALRLAWQVLFYITSEYGVTSKRVLGKTGFIRRDSLDIVLGKVEAVRLHQNLLGRILNYGELEVTGTGGTEEVLRFIPNPLHFRQCIQEQVWNITQRETNPAFESG